ncbi:MAG: ankyrin repeat domain-containing protein [Thermoleophilaceae bacterium]
MEVIVVERIDLGQARRRAKELLRQWRAAGRDDVRLAHAQREIARGLGFPSWPAMVNAVEAESVAREERHARFVEWAGNGRADRAEALLALDPGLRDAGLDVALLLGDHEAVGRALEANPALVEQETGQRSWPPLLYPTHSAFLGGERTDQLVRTAELLLEAGADPNASWRHPEFGDLSALYGAAGVAHEPRMTRLLLDRGATPDDGESLYHSCEARDHTVLRMLLDAGARVDGTNSIRHMLDYEDPQGLRLLLERGVEQEGRGWPELDGTIRWALGRERSRPHIELLVEHGAPVHPDDATLAVRRGRTDLLDLLGEAAPTAADELMGAIRHGDRTEADRVLAAHPGLLGTLGRGDHDTLVHAASLDNEPAVRLMLELGFPVGVLSEEFNETALHAASWYGRAAIVSLLLDNGADPNAKAGEPIHGTPLGWAVNGSRHADHGSLTRPGRVDHRATVERLLSAGAELGEGESADDAADDVADLFQ